MKRIALFVMAIVFAFTMTVVAAEKAATTTPAAPVAKTVATDKAPADDKKVDDKKADKKPAKKAKKAKKAPKKEEMKKEEAPAAPEKK